MESNLLKCLLVSRESFTALSSVLEIADLSDFGRVLYNIIEDYYDKDETAQAVDKDILLSKLAREYPKLTVIAERLLTGLQDFPAHNVLEEYVEIKKDNLRANMQDALAARKDDRLSELFNKYSTLSIIEDDDEVVCGVHPNDILSDVCGDTMIRLFPKALNEAVGGGVPPATAVVLFGRPDMGKTAAIINQIYGSCRDKVKTLYCSNEDPKSKLIQRLLSRFSNMTLDEIRRDPDKCFRVAVENGYNNLLFTSMEPGSIAEIERMIIKHKPQLVVIDQIRNLKSKEDNRVLQLEQMAAAVRQLGKRYNCVIYSATQAGEAAENRRVLGMTDLDSSKTGIPGQADLMIGIGGNGEDKLNGRRILSICKNKLNGSYANIPVRMFGQLSKLLSE